MYGSRPCTTYNNVGPQHICNQVRCQTPYEDSLGTLIRIKKQPGSFIAICTFGSVSWAANPANLGMLNPRPHPTLKWVSHHTGDGFW